MGLLDKLNQIPMLQQIKQPSEINHGIASIKSDLTPIDFSSTFVPSTIKSIVQSNENAEKQHLNIIPVFSSPFVITFPKEVHQYDSSNVIERKNLPISQGFVGIKSVTDVSLKNLPIKQGVTNAGDESVIRTEKTADINIQTPDNNIANRNRPVIQNGDILLNQPLADVTDNPHTVIRPIVADELITIPSNRSNAGNLAIDQGEGELPKPVVADELITNPHTIVHRTEEMEMRSPVTTNAAPITSAQLHQSGNNSIVLPSAINIKSPTVITLPKESVEQGKDKFKVSDVLFLAGAAAALASPELIHGFADIEKNKYAASVDKAKNNPTAVHGDIEKASHGATSTNTPARPYINSGTGQEIDDTPSSLKNKPVNIDSQVQAVKGLPGNIHSYATLTYAQIKKRATDSVSGQPSKDFREDLQNQKGTVKNSDYEHNNLVSRIGVGPYGKVENVDRSDYTNNLGLEDKINTAISDDSFKDLIKLKFKDLRSSKSVQFRSYINAFTDTQTPEYDDVSYIGRSDYVKNIKKVVRTVSLDFTVAAGTRKELQVIYQKLNALSVLVLPEVKQYMISPFIEFTLGDWFKSIPACITSLTNSVKMDLYPWEINMKPDKLFEAPKIVDVSLQIHIFGHRTPSVENNQFDML